MKKVISILAALFITLGTMVSAADFNQPLTIKNYEPTTLTPTGGMLVEEGIVTNTGRRSGIRMLSSGSQQTFEEYLREQLINHATTVNVAKFRIPASEFSHKYFAFVFCNSDLAIRAAYSSGVSFTENGEEYMQSVNPVYIYDTKAECDRKYKELDALTTSLANYASRGKTELEKALFLFDKISLDYCYTPGETYEKINYTPYSFLDNGHGMCQGYATLYKLALEKLGIESYLCGNYNPEINHAWNYIKIDGSWYHADPTWSYYSNAEDMVSRKYFLLSDAAIADDGLHGIKSEWEAQRSGLTPIDCTNDEYKEGYLFRDFTGEPIYRDEASLYFSTAISTETNQTYNLSIRNDSLKSPDAIISVPDSSCNVYLLTLRELTFAFHIITASYDGYGNFLKCSKLTAPGLSGNTLIELPTYTPDNGDRKVKWMLLSASTLSPITYYAETTIAEEGK